MKNSLHLFGFNQSRSAKVISADFKNYDEKGSFGMGQVEVTTLEEIDGVKSSMRRSLRSKQSHGLDWAMFLITDVIKKNLF